MNATSPYSTDDSGLSPPTRGRTDHFSTAFYRAMHYSAMRGLAIACRRSVCPSVCDVGGSGPHRLIILETNCAGNYPNIFALRSRKIIHLLPGEHGEILGRLEVGWKKWRAGAQKWQYL